MLKTFITERDIEDMVRRGVMELTVTDCTVLTDLAYEKANNLGLSLLQTHSQPPAAPVRPYLSNTTSSEHQHTAWRSITNVQGSGSTCLSPAIPTSDELKARVIEAVTSRLGARVDARLLATIVERVLVDLGVH